MAIEQIELESRCNELIVRADRTEKEAGQEENARGKSRQPASTSIQVSLRWSKPSEKLTDRRARPDRRHQQRERDTERERRQLPLGRQLMSTRGEEKQSIKGVRKGRPPPLYSGTHNTHSYIYEILAHVDYNLPLFRWLLQQGHPLARFAT